MCFKRDEFKADFVKCEQDLRELCHLRSHLVRVNYVFEREEKLNSLELKINHIRSVLADLRYILSKPCSYDGCR